jgi:four helix bundle protein
MNFDNLLVWQKSKKLAIDIIKSITHSKNFVLKEQITRSAVSIPSNIAEGFERGGNKEIIRFLYIAKGSCGELRTQLLIAKEIELIDIELCDKFIEETVEISYMLNSLINKRRSFSE